MKAKFQPKIKIKFKILAIFRDSFKKDKGIFKKNKSCNKPFESYMIIYNSPSEMFCVPVTSI